MIAPRYIELRVCACLRVRACVCARASGLRRALRARGRRPQLSPLSHRVNTRASPHPAARAARRSCASRRARCSTAPRCASPKPSAATTRRRRCWSRATARCPASACSSAFDSEGAGLIANLRGRGHAARGGGRFRLQQYFDSKGARLQAGRRDACARRQAAEGAAGAKQQRRQGCAADGPPPHHASLLACAPGDRLRTDMLSRFAGRFSVERRILAIDCVIE